MSLLTRSRKSINLPTLNTTHTHSLHSEVTVCLYIRQRKIYIFSYALAIARRKKKKTRKNTERNVASYVIFFGHEPETTDDTFTDRVNTVFGENRRVFKTYVRIRLNDNGKRDDKRRKKAVEKAVFRRFVVITFFFSHPNSQFRYCKFPSPPPPEPEPVDGRVIKYRRRRRDRKTNGVRIRRPTTVRQVDFRRDVYGKHTLAVRNTPLVPAVRAGAHTGDAANGRA